MSDHEIETVRAALRRVEPSSYSREIARMLDEGETPDADTMRRAGLSPSLFLS